MAVHVGVNGVSEWGQSAPIDINVGGFREMNLKIVSDSRVGADVSFWPLKLMHAG